jgi:uncharacterized protein (TIGR03032 family)
MVMSVPTDSQPVQQVASAGGDPKLEIMGSRGFNTWLAEQQVSLAFTTYQTGKLFLIGMQPNGRLSVFERTFNRCMGLWSNGQTLWMSSLYQLWRFENALLPKQMANGYDRLYVPRVGHVTGDVDIHDVTVDSAGRILFVNTLFGCLATVSQSDSFTPLWQPPFISKLAAEDRCHLNGLALTDGRPQYMTMVAQTDVADGWRDRRGEGGCVMDIRTNEVIAAGLSMPHSPRVYRDDLWLLDSGTGFFGRVDRKKGHFEPITFCPGYLRGLAFVGDYAVVGLSHSRENRTFQGLALDDNLRQRNADTRCGLFVIHLPSGDVVHWLRIEGIVQELYDVVVLPQTVRPMALGFKTDEIQRTISIGDAQPV